MTNKRQLYAATYGVGEIQQGCVTGQYPPSNPFEKKRDVIDLDPRPLCRDEQNSKTGLYDATPDCDGRIYDFYRGGGVKCTNCNGWFCF